MSKSLVPQQELRRIGTLDEGEQPLHGLPPEDAVRLEQPPVELGEPRARTVVVLLAVDEGVGAQEGGLVVDQPQGLSLLAEIRV